MVDSQRTFAWVPGHDVPRRYADVSGDSSEIHLDDELARREGFPGVILHGMHVFGQIVSMLDRKSGECSVARVSARFVDVAIPGEPIYVDFRQSDAGALFEADQRGRLILSAGTATFTTNTEESDERNHQ